LFILNYLLQRNLYSTCFRSLLSEAGINERQSRFQTTSILIPNKYGHSNTFTKHKTRKQKYTHKQDKYIYNLFINMSSDSESTISTVPYNERSVALGVDDEIEVRVEATSKVKDKHNKHQDDDDIVRKNDLFIKTMTPEETASLVASLLPHCQANLAKAVTSCKANASNNNNQISTGSNDVKVGVDNPRTNVCKGYKSSRSNDLLEHKLSVSGKRTKMNQQIDMPKQKKKKQDDEISLHPSSDIETKIAQLTKTSEEEDSSSEDEFDLKALRAEYIDEDETGPAVDNGLAELFKEFRDKGLSKDKVAQKAKENPRPENCNLETKLVNPEIWSNIVTKVTDLWIYNSKYRKS